MLKYTDNKLYIDDVKLEDIATRYGTPSYIYSANQITHNFNIYKEAFAEFKPIICYAVKASSNINILKLLADLGAGFDCVSEGEFRRTQVIGMDTQKKTIASGVGKSNKEIEYYIQNDILLINAESIEEIVRINKIAQKLSRVVDIGIRINPDVDANTLEKIRTGKKDDKFGINIDDFFKNHTNILKLDHINISSISFHIGSQITSIEPYRESYRVVSEFVKQIQALGFTPKYIDIGGGVGIQYGQESTIDLNDLARCYKDTLGHLGLQLILEPGRSITGNAGLLLAEVLEIKRSNSGTSFIIINAGMNDNMRPAMYGAQHKIVQTTKKNGDTASYQIVGPICESSDIFTKDFKATEICTGDLMAILDCGAYCFSMSSNYNTRLLPNEVLVHKNQVSEIRKRQTYEDLFKSEIVI